MPFIFQKKWVLKYLIRSPLSLRLVEVIHVELPDERREIVVLEVLREYLIAEEYRVLNYEAISFWLRPIDNTRCASPIDNFK